MNYGEYIKTILKQRGKTQRWLAEKLDLDEKTLSARLPKGYFNIDELFAIASLLDIDLNIMRGMSAPLFSWLMKHRFSYLGKVCEVAAISSNNKLVLKPIEMDSDDEKTHTVDIFNSYISFAVTDFPEWGKTLYEKLLSNENLVIHRYPTASSVTAPESIEIIRVETRINATSKTNPAHIVSYVLIHHNNYLDENILTVAKHLDSVKVFTDWFAEAIEKPSGFAGPLNIVFEESQISKAEHDLLAFLHGQFTEKHKIKSGVDDNRVAELIAIFQKGTDWEARYRHEINKINSKYESKLSETPASGDNEKANKIKKKWEDEISNSKTLANMKALTASHPKPTDEQKQMAEEAANEIIKMHESFITFFIRKHYPSYLGTPYYDDLVNVCRMGLFMGIVHHNSNLPLSVSAVYYMKRAVYEYMGELTTFSSHHKSQVDHYNKAIDELKKEGNENPKLSEIAEKMDIGLNAALNLVKIMHTSRPSPVRESSIGDMLLFGPEDTPESLELFRKAKEAMEKLPEEQKLVINCMYLGEEVKSFSEIGIELAKLRNPGTPDDKLTPVGSSDIRRIKITALRHLREILLR